MRATMAGVITLLLLFVLVVGFRAAQSFASPFYDPAGESAFYPAEAGIQYHWANRFAAGEKLPGTDVRAQFPEGLRMAADITLFMEPVAGWTYRFIVAPLLRISFFDYSIWFIAVVSALPLLIAWGLGRVLGGSAVAGWVAAGLLALHPLGLDRVVRNFGRENFALTFVFLPLLGLAFAWRESRKPEGKDRLFRNPLVLAGILIAVVGQYIAFASWHLSRALFEVEVLALVVLSVLGGLGSVERKTVAVWLALLVPAELLIPALRERAFVLSPGVVLGHFFVLNELLVGRIRRHAPRLSLLTCLGAAALWLRPGTQDTHLLSVTASKLKFLLQKPADPTLLSPEARMLWIEAFLSPSIEQVVTFVIPFLLLIGVATVLNFERVRSHWKESAALRFLVVLTLFWLGAFALFFRLHVMLVFNLCVLAGVLAACMESARQRAVHAGLAVVVMLFFGWQTSTPFEGNWWRRNLEQLSPRRAEAFVNRQADTDDLLHWIRGNTGHDDVFGGWIGMSSLVYAYADRPVVVQSKFENPTVRGKLEELASALYGKEQELADFCLRYGVKFFVYEAPFLLSDSTESLRYVAGHREIETSMTVFAMHFFSYDLERFELVYQNGGFRVFQFLESDAQAYRNLPVGWEAVFERDHYRIERGHPYDDSQTSAVVAGIRSLEMIRAVALGLETEGRMQDAKQALELVVSREPRYWRAWLSLARLNWKQGDLPGVRNACLGAMQGYPDCPEARRLLKLAGGNEG
jgi:hypothetical protein